MFRTVSIIARLCRMPAIHSRILSPIVINSVRFKYQNHGHGDRGAGKKGPIKDDLDDVGESTMETEYNLLDDK
jgi:hypothetical protein